MERQFDVRVGNTGVNPQNRPGLMQVPCRSPRRWLVASTCTLSLVFVAGLSMAADVLGFSTAAHQGKGCGSIPYPVARKECEDYQTDKDKTCKNFGNRKTEVQKLIKTVEEKTKSLEEARQRNNKWVIPDLETAIAKARKDITGIQADAAGMIQSCTECISARKRVQRVFSEVKTKVQAEKDEELQPYIPTLVKKYEDGAVSHQQPIVDVESAKAAWMWIKGVTVP